jgi:hypothetical protein
MFFTRNLAACQNPTMYFRGQKNLTTAAGCGLMRAVRYENRTSQHPGAGATETEGNRLDARMRA